MIGIVILLCFNYWLTPIPKVIFCQGPPIREYDILLLLVSPGTASQLVCRIQLLAHIITETKSKLLVMEQMLVLHDSTKKAKLFAVIRFVGVRVLYAIFVCFMALDCTIW